VKSGPFACLQDVMCNLMRHLITIVFTLKLGLVFGQASDIFAFPEIIKEGQTITDFVPDRWTILHSTVGDLNNDNRMDMAIVLQSKDSLETNYFIEYEGEMRVNKLEKKRYKRRILLILFKDSLTNKFDLIEQSNTIILCHENSKSEDPFKEIKIDNGLLKILYGYYSINNSYQYFFKYKNGEFILTRAYWHLGESNVRETNNFDFETKIWLKTVSDLKTGKIYKEASKDLNSIPIQTLKTFKRPFSLLLGEYINL